MSDLERLERARYYMRSLADGIDPISGKLLPGDTVLNQVAMARCFFFVAETLDKLIARGGVPSSVAKGKFALSQEQQSAIEVTDEPVGINDLAKRINAVVDTRLMKGATGVALNAWLMKIGYLEEVELEGKKQKAATEKGKEAGIDTRQISTPEGRRFFKNVYNREMQTFIIARANDALSAE
jgi:hypothetical protein